MQLKLDFMIYKCYEHQEPLGAEYKTCIQLNICFEIPRCIVDWYAIFAKITFDVMHICEKSRHAIIVIEKNFYLSKWTIKGFMLYLSI